MTRRVFPMAALMLAGAAFAAAAQQPTAMSNQSSMPCDMRALMMGPMMHGRMSGEMGEHRMGGMRNDSSMMAHMRTDLGLTDAQVQQLRDMHQRACAAAAPHIQMAMQAHQAAMQALTGDNPSIDHYEDNLDQAAKHMVEAMVEVAKQVIAFRSTLTPDQRQKWDQMHQRMMQGPQ